MSDLMTFPKTWEEFERSYGFIDKDEVYTNGARLIPSFRVEQWLEHVETQTIDAEPVRHGKWIECESENGIHIHKCSECGNRDMYKGTFRDWNGREFSFYYKRQYCPSCGAKMEEEN